MNKIDLANLLDKRLSQAFFRREIEKHTPLQPLLQQCLLLPKDHPSRNYDTLMRICDFRLEQARYDALARGTR